LGGRGGRRDPGLPGFVQLAGRVRHIDRMEEKTSPSKPADTSEQSEGRASGVTIAHVCGGRPDPVEADRQLTIVVHPAGAVTRETPVWALEPDLGFRDPDLTVEERVAAKAALPRAIAVDEVDQYLDLGCNDVQLVIPAPQPDDATDNSDYVCITVNRSLNRITVDTTEELYPEVRYNVATVLAMPMLANRQISMELLRGALILALSEFQINIAEVSPLARATA
jgi:hypothetical protein